MTKTVEAADQEGAMKLIFAEPGDLLDPYGKLHCGANGLRLLGEASETPPMRVRCAALQDDGSYMVYGYQAQQFGP